MPEEQLNKSKQVIDPASQAFAAGLGDALLTHDHLDELSLERAKRAQRRTGERFDFVLTRLGIISEDVLLRRLADYIGASFLEADEMPKEALFSKRLSDQFVRTNRIVPISVTETTLLIATVDPFNIDAIAGLSYLSGLHVKCALATSSVLDRTIDLLYGGQDTDAAVDLSEMDGTAGDEDVARLRDIASEAPIIQLVNRIISGAVEQQASDIHFEPSEDTFRVRYRMDGALVTKQNLSTGARQAVTSRIKVLAKLDIAERRLPQDGRIKFVLHGKEIDMRVSTTPTLYGESVVLRILDRSNVDLTFPALGFAGDGYDGFQKLLEEPNGIILVTGPTGSGKTTTLYTSLRQLNREATKIFTVEDPVEYQLEGINQIQVHSKIGLDFASSLRSILRQDPDIIMIGEIRDLETAQIAVQSSLTGHLVFSTLHTNSAASTITRLVDMGVEDYLIASTLLGVVAQRLVRRLCLHCARPAEVTPGILARLEERTGRSLGNEHHDLKQAVGCDACRQTGYDGRTTIMEVLIVDDPIREALVSAANDRVIEKTAIDAGMHTMLENGLRKAIAGETTIDEVLRVTRSL